MLKSVSDVKEIVSKHHDYRRKCLNMIASEQCISPTVRRLLACDFEGRYSVYRGIDPSEPRPYPGNEFMAEMEAKTQELAKQIYGARFVDFRPLGGLMAGEAVILGLTRPGDTIYEAGRYLTNEMVASKLVGVPNKHIHLEVRYYPIDVKERAIDMNVLSQQISRLERKPKLFITGNSAPLFPHPVREMKELAARIGAYVVDDSSHVMGLIAGRHYPRPLEEGADVEFGSTHKTLCGPQGGAIFTNDEELAKRTNPRPLVASHHVQRIPALAIALLEMREFGEALARQTVRNSKELGKALSDLGIDVYAAHKGFSSTHVVLPDVTKFGNAIEESTRRGLAFEQANILLNTCYHPLDESHDGKRKSGLRIGTQELTRIGMKEGDMDTVAVFFRRLLIDHEKPGEIARDVEKFAKEFNALEFTFDQDADPYEILL